jgi:hypothetical protein
MITRWLLFTSSAMDVVFVALERVSNNRPEKVDSTLAQNACMSAGVALSNTVWQGSPGSR